MECVGELRSQVGFVEVLKPRWTSVIVGSTERELGPSHGRQTGRSVPTQGMTVGLHRGRLRH
jgi:hypothetical protein